MLNSKNRAYLLEIVGMNYRKLWIENYGPIPVDEKGRSYEIHHIDGNRKNNSLNNLLCLSVEDHFKLHYDKGEFYAAHLIAQRIKDLSVKVTEREINLERIKKLRESKLGGKNPMKDPKVAQKVANALRGRKKSAEAEKKRLETAKKNGTLRRTEETRAKMKKPKAKINCPHCKLEGGISQMKRWHFSNCKEK